MQPLLVFIADPFAPQDARARTGREGALVLDEVRRVFPEVAALDVVVTRRGAVMKGDEHLAADDVVEILSRPMAVAIAASPFWTAVVTSLISAAISFLVAYLTRPKNRNKNASPSYNINFDQNVPRLGDTIPVIYGRVLSTPDVAAQPYTEYVAHNERASLILCLGMGEYQINDIYVGETRVSDYPPGNIQTWIYPPSLHGSRFGVIEQQTGVCENMITLPESTGIDLAAPNDPPEVAIGASVSGGVLIPNNPTEASLWTGLIPGRQYTVSNSLGGRVVATYIGQGANNSAVFDQALPAPPEPTHVAAALQLTPIDDAQEGRMMLIYSQQELPSIGIGEIIYVRDGPKDYGPFEVARSEVRWTRLYLRMTGPGFTTETGEQGIYPQKWVWIMRNMFVMYYVSEYVAGVDPAEPYRWRGWFATSRPGTVVDTIYVDLTAPNGLAWITDKGDYKSITVTMFVDIQQIDDAGTPVGGVRREVVKMAGATSSARRITYKYAVPAGRYRVRVARATTRDQRASKELSSIVMSSIRCRVASMAVGARCYEECTLLVMQFIASAGLSAASNRRVKVDCTRKLPPLGSGAPVATQNPADAFADAYTNRTYGGGRPLAEIDSAKLAQMRAQWNGLNGFNAVLDHPSTLIESLQSILGPVRAMPLPTGNRMSISQDCPRPKAYVFGPDTIVKDSLQIAYNFAGVDEPDCIEVTYTDATSFTDARAYYPSEGVNPTRAELFGCTDRNHALSWARLSWQERRWSRKTVRLDLEGEGYLVAPLTRFGVIIPVIDHANAGLIVNLNRDANLVTLDQPFPLGASFIYFKRGDGTVGDPVFCNIPDQTKPHVIQCAAIPVDAFEPDALKEGSRWAAGLGQRFDFRATDLQSSDNMRVSVDGTEYSANIYAGTFVENWSP